MNTSITLIAYALDISPLVLALQGDDVHWNVFQHSHNQDVIGKCLALSLTVPNFNFYDYRENRGLATSWNDGLILSREADAMIIMNDDVIMDRNDLLILASAAVEHREAGLIICRGLNGPNRDHIDLDHVIFAVNPIAVEKVGYFDENYWPIYGEDVDYSRRCRLLGVPYYNAGETGIIHLGSTTIKTVPALNAQNMVTFPRNEEYHRLKHGGGYGHETFLHPFNDEQLSWKIESRMRHNPYPEYERRDKDVAKI